jgi:hypothetical protein
LIPNITKGAGFACAPRGFILWIEIDHGIETSTLREANPVALPIHPLDIGGPSPDGEQALAAIGTDRGTACTDTKA